VIAIVVPPGHAAEREYIARVLFEEFLGLPISFEVGGRADTEIRVRGDDRRRLVLGEGLFAVSDADWLSEGSLPRLPLPRFDIAEGPFAEHPADAAAVLYGSPTWSIDGDTLRLDIDILGSSFFMLTRYEEAVVSARDEHDRFPATATIAASAGLVRRPVVNEWLELLWLALHHVWPALERRRLQFSIAPSHDVDWPLAGESGLAEMLRRAASDTVVSHDPRASARRLVGYAAGLAGKHHLDVNNTFDAIMDASESRGLRSAFYFIADRRAGLIDGNYSLDDPWIRGLLRRIHVRGHEIGLHTSYTTPTDGAQTRYERDRLVRVLDEEGIELDRLGGRQHFLRWRNPITWRNWADAGLDYDSTLGFSEEIGFRAGVCLEYPVFDLEQKRPLALRELPLAAMEVAALDRLQLGPASALEAIIELRETCRRYNGTFTLLWHNSRLVHRTERRLYLEALGS
jgi:peptidoglycan/xylan/chitin deacetylase (PgdA/CDA1 family)